MPVGTEDGARVAVADAMRGVPHAPTGSDADSVDLVEIGRGIRRNWATVLATAVLGVLAALAVVVFVPPRYHGAATVLVRSANANGASLLSRLGSAGDLAASAGAGGIGNALSTPLETELRILDSRDVLGQVVDSLGLQARVLSPRGVAAARLLAPARYPGAFRPVAYTFTPSGASTYQVSGPTGPLGSVRAGTNITLPQVGAVTVVPTAAAVAGPFRVDFEDREDAITRLAKRVTVDKKGGELASVDYSGPDSLTAADVPNTLVAVYLQRRRTVDRGTNQRRFEFLTTQADSLQRALRVAEDALRAQQDASGLYDPDVVGKSEIEALQALQTRLSDAETERSSARRAVEQAERGAIAPRQLTAFPTFLRSPAINSLLTQLTQLETQRDTLLERRTERDPQVIALAQSIAQIERQFVPLARTYAASLDRQAAELTRESGVLESRLTALPGQALANVRRQREVRRLSQTVLGLQSELIDVRLSAMGEGGQVRQVDVAYPPKDVGFPRPLLTVAAGFVAGLIVGALIAAVRALLATRLVTAADVERATGLPVYEFDDRRPLLAVARWRGVLTLVPVPAGAPLAVDALARAIAEQARTAGRDAVALDHIAAVARVTGTPVGDAPNASSARPGLLVAGGVALDDARALALLDATDAVLLCASPGRTRRAALVDAATTLAGAGIPCDGVLLVLRPPAARSSVGDGERSAESPGRRSVEVSRTLAGNGAASDPATNGGSHVGGRH